MASGWDSIKEIFRRSSRSQTFDRIPPENAGDVGGLPLVANECYVEVKLSRMHLRYDGFLNKEYYPLAHSFVELAREGSDRVIVPCVAQPKQLSTAAGEGNEDLIVVQNIPLMGPTPYIGGAVSVAIGLCAAERRDYLDDLLGVLGSLSGIVGGTALTGALNVIAPLKEGAESLLRLSDKVQLRLGVINGFSPTTGGRSGDESALLDGYYAVIGVDERENNGPLLQFRNNQLLVEYKDSGIRPVTQDHLVFEIIQHDVLADWSRIPGLYAARQKVHDAAINKGLDSDAYRHAFGAFKLAIVASADLTAADRVIIVDAMAKQAEQFANYPPVDLHGPADPATVLAEMAALGLSLSEARKISPDSL